MNLPHWIDTPVAEALGWTLLHSLWIGGLVAVVTIVWLRISGPSKALQRSQRWLISLFSLVLIHLGVFLYFLSQAQTPAITAPPENVFFAVESFGPISSTSNSGEPSFMAWVINALESAIPWLVVVYMLGVALHVIRLMGGWIYLSRLRQTAHAVLPESWSTALSTVTEQLQLNRKIYLKASSWIKSPVQVGHLRPFIIVPEGLASILTIREMEALLAHEIAHILRNDYLINWIQSVVEVLFFYHPAVWFINNQVRKEREHACDDLALQVIEDPRALAKALVAHEELSVAAQPRLALGFTGHRNQLLHRVKRILNMTPMNTKPAFHWPSLTLGLVALLLLVQAVIPNQNKSTEQVTIKSALSIPDHPEIPAPTETNEPTTLAALASLTPHVPQDTGKDLQVSLTFKDRPYEKAALKMKDGEIKWLKVDGKRVDPDDYNEYASLINELSSVGEPGWAPSPPAFHVQPPMPPNFSGMAVPTPPTPPAFNVQVPPIPPITAPIPPMPAMTGDTMTEEEWEQWQEAFEEQMKGFEEHMKQFELEMEGWENEFMKPFEEQMEAFEHEMEKWEEQYGQEFEAQMEDYEREMEVWGEQFEEKFEKQMEAFERQMEIYEQKMEEYEEEQEALADELGETLHADGIIESTDHFQLYIDNKEMKVNGAKQPSSVHKKYLKMLEERNGKPLSDGSSYSISR